VSLTSPPTAKAGNNTGLNLYKGAVSVEAAPFLSSTPGVKRTAEDAEGTENTTVEFNDFVFSLHPLRFIFPLVNNSLPVIASLFLVKLRLQFAAHEKI
jgi:hypothetical protein